MDRETREQTKLFKALSDPTRRKILEILQAQGTCSVGAIVSNFALAQPTISRHLAVLKEAELVTDARSKQEVHYSLDTESLNRQLDVFRDGF